MIDFASLDNNRVRHLKKLHCILTLIQLLMVTSCNSVKGSNSAAYSFKIIENVKFWVKAKKIQGMAHKVKKVGKLLKIIYCFTQIFTKPLIVRKQCNLLNTTSATTLVPQLTERKLI